MLEADQRVLLIDALKPPPGFTFNRAVGTTFTLDMDALLIAPVAFALFDVDLGEHGVGVDPISLLESVRRHADRIDLFCQAGEIKVPARYQPILSQLEDSIHPVTAPKGGIFHPKVWAIRFRSSETGESNHRVLCMSRNLTFDRSWDLMLRLDEASTSQHTDGTADLSRLIGALPAMAVQRLPADRRQAITELATDLRRVRFELPNRCTDLSFHAFNVGNGKEIQPSGTSRRLLVASPFVSDDRLQELAQGSPEAILISRQESLDQLLPETLNTFTDIYTLDPAAHDTDADSEAAADDEGARNGLAGLHAKLIISEIGGQVSLLVGSANATDAGLTRNVELMAELGGHRRHIGIDAFLQPNGKGSFSDLLIEYRRGEQPMTPTEGEKAQAAVVAVGHRLAAMPVTARLDEAGDDLYRLRLTSRQKLKLPDGIAVSWWPITIGKGNAIPAAAGAPLALDFGLVSLGAITSFFAFEVTKDHQLGSASAVFVVNAALQGAPEDRRQQVLTAVLRSKRDVLRYLLLLLSDFTDQHAGDFAQLLARDQSVGAGAPIPFELPLFESMVRSLARNPDRLEHVARLVDDLRSRPEGSELLPLGFETVWEPIWAARGKL